MIILAALDPPGLSKTKYTSESSTESNLSFLLFILSIFFYRRTTEYWLSSSQSACEEHLSARIVKSACGVQILTEFVSFNQGACTQKKILIFLPQTMKQITGQPVCSGMALQSWWQLANSSNKTMEIIQLSLGREQVFEQLVRFKNGLVWVLENDRPGQPITSKTSGNLKKINKINK